MEQTTEKQDVIEIAKEDAALRMDKQGRWHNEDGLITKKSIIQYLNRSIARDEKGYYLTHMLGNRREKVYFPYEDTALLIIDIKPGPTVLTALLNTRRKLFVKPEKLFIKNDQLYLDQDGDIIKFSEQSLVRISTLLSDRNGRLMITHAGKDTIIPTRD